MLKIRETIVVEGRDDLSAVRQCIDANIICTHGYGISQETIKQIKTAYETTGIIIFTDPDHAGLAIRNKLSELFPEAKHAYLTETQATFCGDIGVENAAAEDIESAFKRFVDTDRKQAQNTDLKPLSEIDMEVLGLAGCSNSAKIREEVGARLGIGYANVKTFIKRANYLGISFEQIEEILGVKNK